MVCRQIDPTEKLVSESVLISDDIMNTQNVKIKVTRSNCSGLLLFINSVSWQKQVSFSGINLFPISDSIIVILYKDRFSKPIDIGTCINFVLAKEEQRVDIIACQEACI